MGGHFGVGGVDLRLVVAGVGDPGAHIVGHQQLGDATEEGEGVEVGIDPVGQLLGGKGFSVGVVAGPQHGDKELGLVGVQVGPPQGLPGPVDEGLLPGGVALPQGDLQGLLPVPGVAAKLGVAVAIGMAARYSCHNSCRVTPGRLSSRCSTSMGGSGARPGGREGAVRPNRHPQSWAASISSGKGQLKPAGAAPFRYLATVVWDRPQLRPIWRSVSPIWCLRRSTSLIWRMDSLSLGMAPPFLCYQRKGAWANPAPPPTKGRKSALQPLETRATFCRNTHAQ